jgi:hypothetical protein
MKPRSKTGQWVPTVGIVTAKSGHRRFTSPRSMRGKFEHRVIIEQAIEATHPVTRATLPETWETHHMDRKPAHNCLSNLLMLSPEIHSAITAHARARCPFTGRFLSQQEIRNQLGWDKIREEGRAARVPVLSP